MVHPESVAKILGSLDISKAMGPDGVHPRLLRYLNENSSFVDAVVLLFSACASEQYIPEVWKTATPLLWPCTRKGQYIVLIITGLCH